MEYSENVISVTNKFSECAFGFTCYDSVGVVRDTELKWTCLESQCRLAFNILYTKRYNVLV
jgi:hypothetical protein